MTAMAEAQDLGTPAMVQLEDAVTGSVDQRWRVDALCTQTDPEIFYPAKGGSTRAARQVCAACPVQVPCLADALAHRDIDFGVRAGITPRQRRALLRARARRAA